MMVANSFDLWQKDTFFSAAEEVQDSADIMESAYRNWKRQRREGLAPQDLNELCRELQTALGTAKWQLDEFERAVRLSYGNRADDVTRDRHKQFITAIGNQITCVEKELEESYKIDGKQSLRWVNLDEDERDDLAMFLSGTRKTLQSPEHGYDNKSVSSTKSLPLEKQFIENADVLVKVDSQVDVPKLTKGFKHFSPNVDDSHVIDLETNESPETSDSSCGQADRKMGTRKNCSSPNIRSLNITIDTGNDEENALMLSIEATPKEKGTKPLFWMPRCGDYSQPMRGRLFQTQLGGIDRISQLVRMVRGGRRPLQTLKLQRNRPFQVILALMMAVLLIVPFAVYST